jgi:hypothetical protein
MQSPEGQVVEYRVQLLELLELCGLLRNPTGFDRLTEVNGVRFSSGLGLEVEGFVSNNRGGEYDSNLAYKVMPDTQPVRLDDDHCVK